VIKSLRGWKRVTPSRSRSPEPFSVWCAICNMMTAMGASHMAMFLMMGLHTYLRPHQLLSLTGSCLHQPSRGICRFWTVLVHPQGGPTVSKIGEYDVSVVLDGQRFSFLNVAYAALKQRRKPDEKVFLFSYPQYTKVFNAVTKALNIRNLVPYQTRHSGASTDAADACRSMEEIQKRGQWRQSRSVARYDKDAKLTSAFAKHSSELQSHAVSCERVIEGIILYGRHVPCLRPIPQI
jgi:integrase